MENYTSHARDNTGQQGRAGTFLDTPENSTEPLRPAKRGRRGQERQRVTRACDRCKARKTRCSGKHPCSSCAPLNISCHFNASYRRGRLPSIEIDTSRISRLPTQVDGIEFASNVEGDPPASAFLSPESMVTAPAVSETIPERSQGFSASTSQPEEDAPISQSLRPSPEPSQNDRQGHYVGPSSGVSFLLRIQRKLKHQQFAFSSESSIFTFGDRPLPETDPGFFILPTQVEAEHLLSRYFTFASATHRYLHQPTIEDWLHDLYSSNGTLRTRKEAGTESKLAILFMVFAQAETFSTSKHGEERLNNSAQFFAAAERQLSAEKGGIRLTSIQARLTQCLYLLSQSRINHCWSLFGTTAHLIYARGIHRKHRPGSTECIGLIDLECSKRTFWCAYNLDTYLSTALGRPKTFHDEDIDQEMPKCVNDVDLHRTQPGRGTVQVQSLMTGAIAHIELTRIITRILRTFYGIRPPSTRESFQLSEAYKRELMDWRRPLRSFLDATGVDHSLFLPVYLRQRNVLNLAFWHAQILLHRPCLLQNFAMLEEQQENRVNASSGHPNVIENIQQCIDAAMSIVRHVDGMNETGQLYSTYYFTQYFCFCAVVIIYVYAIQKRDASPDQYLKQYELATKCQRHLSGVAISNSFAERYGVILEELRLEVLRRNAFLGHYHMNPRPVDSGYSDANDLSNTFMDSNRSMQTFEAQDFALPGSGQPIPEDSFSGTSPDSFIDQISGWSDFDALVCIGLGGLDMPISENMHL